MDLDKAGFYSQILNYESILENIFDLLSVKEQLTLTYVCKKFNGIIKQLLWKDKFRSVTIYKTRYVNIITRSEHLNLTNLEIAQAPKLALNRQQCEEFLFLNAENIQILNIDAEHSDYQEDQIEDSNFLQLQLFRNLKELCFYRMIVTNDDLETLARSCEKLQKLQLIECFCEHLQPIVPGQDINIENFIQMKMLKELEIHALPKVKYCEIKLDVLHEMLNKLKLRSFILKRFTIDVAASKNLDVVGQKQRQENAPLPSIERLNIAGLTIEFWCTFTNYLKCCHNLRNLTINVSDCNITINLKVIEILSKKCKNLEVLSLENCDINVPDFCKLENLKEMSLISCGGLTFSNLQQILGGLKLLKFQLIKTRVYNICNHIYISPTVQSITIDTIRFTEISEIFQKSLNRFENLHTLNWLSGDINDNWIIDKCPNLKYLHIPCPYLLRRIVFTMKSLTELTFTSCNDLSWCILLILIKDLSLQRLTIRTSNAEINEKQLSEDALKTSTSLKFLTLPFKIFILNKNAWLDLIFMNSDLKYLIYGNSEDILNIGFIVNLLRREQFPNRFSSIKVCGFTLETRGLTYNTFIKQFAYICINTNHYKTQNIDFTIEF